MSSSHAAFEGEDAAAIASSDLPGQPLPSAASCTHALSSILLELEATFYLQKFIDGEQDDDCIPSYRHPDKISSNYGLPPSLASAFVEKCRARASAQKCAFDALQHFLKMTDMNRLVQLMNEIGTDGQRQLFLKPVIGSFLNNAFEALDAVKAAEKQVSSCKSPGFALPNNITQSYSPSASRPTRCHPHVCHTFCFSACCCSTH